MYIVYFLKSELFERFYIGVTADISKRLDKHNKGSTKSTKPYRPWKVVYTENYTDKHEAYGREFFLKHHKGFLEKRAIIEKLNGGVA